MKVTTSRIKLVKIAAIGSLFISLGIHLFNFVDSGFSLGNIIFILHAVVFLIFGPAFLMLLSFTRSFEGDINDNIQKLFKSLPKSFEKVVKLIGLYLLFAIFYSEYNDMDDSFIFSIFWAVFYAIAILICHLLQTKSNPDTQ